MVRARTSGREEEQSKYYLKYMKKYTVKKNEAELVQAARQRIKRITGTEEAFLTDTYEGKPELVAHCEDAYIIKRLSRCL